MACVPPSEFVPVLELARTLHETLVMGQMATAGAGPPNPRGWIHRVGQAPDVAVVMLLLQVKDGRPVVSADHTAATNDKYHNAQPVPGTCP